MQAGSDWNRHMEYLSVLFDGIAGEAHDGDGGQEVRKWTAFSWHLVLSQGLMYLRRPKCQARWTLGLV